jgi:hypothetical protein
MARTLADLAPPAVDMGAPFILLYIARSLLIAIYFVFTCPCLHILVLMYLTCSSHDRPPFLVYIGHGVGQNKPCRSTVILILSVCIRVLASSSSKLWSSSTLDFFPRHFSLRPRALAASSSFYHVHAVPKFHKLTSLSHLSSPFG